MSKRKSVKPIIEEPAQLPAPALFQNFSPEVVGPQTKIAVEPESEPEQKETEVISENIGTEPPVNEEPQVENSFPVENPN